MLNEFRSLNNNIFVKLLLGLLVLSFVIWGIEDMVRRSAMHHAVATVDGEEITTDQFLRGMSTATENIRRMMGDNYSPEILKSLQLPQQVIQRMTNDKAFSIASRDLGLIVDDNEIAQILRNNELFQDESDKFDPRRFNAFLRNSRISEKNYVQQLRDEAGRNLLLAVLLETIPVPTNAAQILLEAREQPRQITLYKLSDAQIGTIPSPTDIQLEEYYKTQSHRFVTPEYRTVSYTVINAQDVESRVQISEEDIKKAYNDRIEEFKRPERREVDQLLYGTEEEAQKAYTLLQQGKAVGAIAKTLPPQNKGSLSLGKVERSGIIDAAADSVFALKEDGFTSPIESDFGWHIFRVNKIIAPTAAPLSEVRTAIKQDLHQQRSENALTLLSNQLEDTVAGGNSLEEAAREAGLKSTRLEPFNNEGKNPSGNTVSLPNLDRFMETVFKTGEKTESSLVSSKGGLYYMVGVEKIVPESIKPLAEVKSQVVKGWTKQEQISRLHDLSSKVSIAFVDRKSREEAIKKHHIPAVGTSTIKQSSKSIAGINLPSALLSEVYERGVGEGTHAYPDDSGNYVLATVDRILPTQASASNKAALDDINDELERNAQNEILNQYINYLMEQYSASIDESALKAVLQ